MTAAETVRQSASGLHGVEINGGDFAGTQDGSRVAKVTPPEPTHRVFAPRNTQVVDPQQGEFSNKQDGNRGVKNGPQGKSPPAAEAISRDLIDLPPAAPIKVMGRPSVLTAEVLDQLCQLVALGFSRAQAAAYLGINRSIITRATQKNVDLQNALQRAEEVSELQPQLTVMAEARKNWRAAAWLMQFKAKHHHRTATDEDRQLAKEKAQEDHDALWDSVRRNNEELLEIDRQATARAEARRAAARRRGC
jgi:hypothetical protein